MASCGFPEGRRAAGMTYRFDDVEIDAAGLPGHEGRRARAPGAQGPRAAPLPRREPGPPRHQGRDPGGRLEGHRGHRERADPARGPDPQGPRGRRARGPLHRDGAHEGLPVRAPLVETGTEAPRPAAATGSGAAPPAPMEPGSGRRPCSRPCSSSSSSASRSGPGRRPPRWRPPAAPPPSLESQVSTSATLNVFPCFSPDGSSIAFATLRSGSMEIVVRALAPGAREVAVTSDGMQNVEPALLAGRPPARLPLRRSRRDLARPRPRGSPPPAHHLRLEPGLVARRRRPRLPGPVLGRVRRGLLVRGRGLDDLAGVGGGRGAPAAHLDRRRRAGRAGRTGVVAGRPAALVRRGPAGRSPCGRDGCGLRQTSRDLWAREVVWERNGRSQLWTGLRAGNWFVWRVPVAPATGEPSRGAAGPRHRGGEGLGLGSPGALARRALDRLRHLPHAVRDPRPAGHRRRAAPWGGRSRSSPASRGGRCRSASLPTAAASRSAPFARGTGPSLWVADLESGEARLVAEQPGLQWSRALFPDGRRSATSRPASEGGASAASTSTPARRGSTGRREPPLVPPLLSPDGRTLVAHGAREGRSTCGRWTSPAARPAP